jgi:hypothetical protein
MATGPFDTYVDRSDYDEWNILYLNHRGYTLIFRNNSNNGIYKVLFVDALGTIVDTMEVTTSDFNYSTGDGFINIITDYDAGIIKFFDGLAVGTYTFDPIVEEAYWDWNWDPTTKNKTFVIYTRNYDTNMVTWKLANAQTGVVSLPSYNNNDYDTEPILYSNGNFVVVPMYNSNTSLHSSIEIYGTDGTLKHSESLTGFTFDSWQGEDFGNGKFSLIYKDNTDDNVEYKIYSYTESTNSFVSTTHVRGYNFRSFNTYSRSLDSPDEDTDSQSIHYMFYGDDVWDNHLYYLEYISFVSLFDGVSYFITNVLSSGTTVGMAWDGDDTKYYNDLVDTGDGKLKSMLIKPDGFHYTEILADVTRLTDYNQRSLNNDVMWMLKFDNVNNTYNYYVINGETGAIKDDLVTSTTNNNNYSYSTSFDTLYIRNYETNEGWYLNRSQPTFTSIGYYNYVWDPSNHFIDDNTWSETGVMVLFNPYGGQFRPVADKYHASRTDLKKKDPNRFKYIQRANQAKQDKEQQAQQQQQQSQMSQSSGHAQELWNKHMTANSAVAAKYRSLSPETKQDFQTEFIDDVAEALRNGTDANSAIQKLLQNYQGISES